jgi:two-component system, LytTR family, sensor kinase
MAMLPIKPTPFFANKNRAFWNLQTLGWAGALALRGISGLANGQPISFLVPIIIATITGYSVSLVMSVIYQTLIDRKPLVTWGVTLIVLLTGSALWAFVDAWVATLYRPGSDSNFTAILLGAFYLDLTLLGAWSALYYAINFFLRIEEQQDQMLRLENQATSAQLAMLRYQLNPHFLFNTLNSISTLVLLKQTEPANLVPALYARQRADRAGDARSGGRDAQALSRYREDALRGTPAGAFRHRDQCVEGAAAIVALATIGRERH